MIANKVVLPITFVIPIYNGKRLFKIKGKKKKDDDDFFNFNSIFDEEDFEEDDVIEELLDENTKYLIKKILDSLGCIIF